MFCKEICSQKFLQNSHKNTCARVSFLITCKPKALHKKCFVLIKDFCSKCDQISRKLRIWSYLLKKSLRILTGRKHPHIKRAYEKYEYGHLGSWYIKSTLHRRFLKWREIEFKRKKLTSYWQNAVLFDRFILFPHSACLNIGSDMAVLYGNDTFSILFLLTKKRYYGFCFFFNFLFP